MNEPERSAFYERYENGIHVIGRVGLSIFPCLAEHENVRAGRALEYIISDAPGMIAGFLSQSYCCTQSFFVLVTISGLKKAI